MKIIIYFFILVTSLLNAQTKESDYFTFYKGGEKHLKPIKYVLFDNNDSLYSKKVNKNEINFYCAGQTFIFNKKKQKIDSSFVINQNEIMVEKPEDLQHKAYLFFKQKKEKVERKNEVKILYPVTGFNNYFKIYILEKTEKDKVIKYEVDWEYSVF